jgi:shikimate dehydrogenase
MSPHEGESPLPGSVLKEGMTVMDIVYRPVRTRLLREAAEHGCRTIDGLEMLARQGAAQFEIWTGRRPDLGEIKEDLLRALDKECPSPLRGCVVINRSPFDKLRTNG